HMNGRVYDPVIGRFLSADPFVQVPEASQSLNPYSYVLNNPLSLTDPTGHFFQFLIPIIAGIVSAHGALAVTQILAGSLGLQGASLALATTIGSAAGFGFGASFSGALLAGADLGDALKAGVIGAATSGVTAGALAGVDAVLPDWLNTADVVRKVDGKSVLSNAQRLRIQLARGVARGAVRGGISELRGGDFEDAFWHSFAADTLALGRDYLVDVSIREGGYVCSSGPGACGFGENWKENGWRPLADTERADLYRSVSSRLVPPTAGPELKIIDNPATGTEFPFSLCGGNCNQFGKGHVDRSVAMGSFPSRQGMAYEGSWFSTLSSRYGPFLHSTSVFHDSLAFLSRNNFPGSAGFLGLAAMPVAFATEAAILSPQLRDIPH
ncbi:MAG: hypothetical protein KDD47_22710, partial [Acidobacteria bacterium]|nr:hypothetical protein [Acidobacteriota bacterium]